MPEPAIREQLLHAALAAASVHGVAKLSMGDVARAAGLSRQTLYRYFPNKDALLAEVVATETTKLIEQVVAAGAGEHGPREQFEAGILAALRATRDHPLLDRLLRTEPEVLLPLLVAERGPATTQIRPVVELIISLGRDDLDPGELRRIADVVTRLLISYAVSAPDEPPEIVAAFLAEILTRTTDPGAHPSDRSPSPTGA